MALAYVRVDGWDGNGCECMFDLGVNRYYYYAIGTNEIDRRNGLEFLRERTHESELAGPLPPHCMGRGRFRVPADWIDRENRFLQLYSFRTENRIGPALSSIVQLPLPRRDLNESFVSSLSQESIMPTMSRPVETVRMRYREVPYGQAMFFGMLGNLLPQIGNIVGGLFGGGGSGGGGGGGGGGGILSQLTNPETIQSIMRLIGQISSAGGTAAGAAPAAAAPAALATGLSRGATTRALTRFRRSGNYSEAQVAPALLAALPALMPVLQRVLSPETIQSVINQPTQHLNTIMNGMRDFARLGIESHEQDLRHLRELNPGVDDRALDSLLASMSLSVSLSSHELTYARSEKVKLRFEDVGTQTVFNKLKLPYLHGRAWKFPMSVETPKMIRSGVIELIVKNAHTLKTALYKRFPIRDVSTGPLGIAPEIDETESKSLTAGTDYLICVSLVWKNREGKRRGTSMQQRISCAGPYVFDRIEESSELIALSDSMKYRPFWHKLWQGTFSGDSKRYRFSCRYYTVLRPASGTNARTATKISLKGADNGVTEGSLRAAMEYSPDELNRLLSTIGNYTILNEEELSALRSDDFAQRFNQGARYHAKLRGRERDSAALWVYPEVKVQTIVLQKVTEVDDNGHVRGFTEKKVQFPMPVLVHFIGVRTE